MTAADRTNLEIRILHEGDIVDVRQAVRAMAQAHGFDSFAITALTTVASELARNIWVYAGRARSRSRWSAPRCGSGCSSCSRTTVPDRRRRARAARRVQHRGSLGMGLAGSRRLVDEFEIVTAVGRGTRITVRKWKTVR